MLRETKLVYFGHSFTGNDGIEPEENKVWNFAQISTLEDKEDVHRLLGLRNYVGKFITNL